MSKHKLKIIDDDCLKDLKKESKCCIIINDLIYDVSTFYEHPGGFDIFKDYEGTDATKFFNEIGHSSNAKKLMKNYLIGIKKDTETYRRKLETKTVENDVEYISISEEEDEEEEEEKEKEEEHVEINKPINVII